MKIRTLPAIAAVLIVLSACGSSSDPTAASTSGTTVTSADTPADTSAETSGSAGDPVAPADGDVVTISSSRFDNTELRVAPGTTVTFVNTDPFDHTITSRDGSTVEFDSGNLGQDETFEFTFDEPGEYAYFCQIHPTMRAVVIVA